MSKIEIFEAAGCCATSSVVVSDEAVKWNASAEWAKKNDVDIQRYSPHAAGRMRAMTCGPHTSVFRRT